MIGNSDNVVIAYDGETLSDVCWRIYADSSYLEQIIELNPDLLSAQYLSAGDKVLLPYIDGNWQNDAEITRLWD